jgi:hypothetical protein
MSNVVPLNSWHRPQIPTLMIAGPFNCCTLVNLIDGKPLPIPSREPPLVVHDQHIGLLTALHTVFGSGRPITAKLVREAARKFDVLRLALDGRIDDSTHISSRLSQLEGRIVDGHVLKRNKMLKTSFKNATVWVFEAVDPKVRPRPTP